MLSLPSIGYQVVDIVQRLCMPQGVAKARKLKKIRTQQPARETTGFTAVGFLLAMDCY